ncbi:MAG: alanine racemase [Bacteroidales bacterium]|nr:alanine racemase [Bacteroidales bacterium]
MDYSRITSPALLIDSRKAKRNIRNMAVKAEKAGVDFRPHFKTHQSAEIGNWFRESGVNKITVSSVMMAEYFQHHGWDNITIAFPVNHREINRINALAEKCDLNLLIDSADTGAFISENLKCRAGVFIEAHSGYFRSGVYAKDYDTVDEIISSVEGNDNIRFMGFLTHNGQTYKASGEKQIRDLHSHSLKLMNDLRERYSRYFENIIISIGDTPSCSINIKFEGVNEIRPGNFVFYDLMQEQLGSCQTDDIAIALAAPVVTVNRKRNEVVIYGGAVHLSKEYIVNDKGEATFGMAVQLLDNRWEPFPGGRVILISLSQAHGVLKFPDEIPDNIRPGSLIGILPVHSCLTTHLMKSFISLENQNISCFRGNYTASY